MQMLVGGSESLGFPTSGKPQDQLVGDMRKTQHLSSQIPCTCTPLQPLSEPWGLQALRPIPRQALDTFHSPLHSPELSDLQSLPSELLGSRSPMKALLALIPINDLEIPDTYSPTITNHTAVDTKKSCMALIPWKL